MQKFYFSVFESLVSIVYPLWPRTYICMYIGLHEFDHVSDRLRLYMAAISIYTAYSGYIAMLGCRGIT